MYLTQQNGPIFSAKEIRRCIVQFYPAIRRSIHKCIQQRKWRILAKIFAFLFAKSMEILLQIHHVRFFLFVKFAAFIQGLGRLLTSRANLIKLLQVKITTPRTVTSQLRLTTATTPKTSKLQKRKRLLLRWVNFTDQTTVVEYFERYF